MARQTIAAQDLTHGLNPTFSAILAADDAQFAWESDLFLALKNTTGGSLDVTIKTNQAVDGLTVPDLTITVPANATRYSKKFPKDTYRQSDGKVYINTASDGISAAVLRVA